MTIDQQLLKQLSKLRGSKTLIVTIGNTMRGDDGAGPLVCQKLRRAKISAELIDAATVPENYIQPIIQKDPQNLLIVDAVNFGASPGQIKTSFCFVGIQPEHVQLGGAVNNAVLTLSAVLVEIFHPKKCQ